MNDDRLESDEFLTHLWLPYCQMKTMAQPLRVVETHGNQLVLENGRRLIDGVASWWTACHGYNDPSIATAVQNQLSKMPHVMLGGLVHGQALRLAKRLATLTGCPNGKVFFSDSGSVAIEVAMKIAVQYFRNQGHSDKTKFLCFKDSYHGDTVGAMSLCDPVDSMHHRFKGFLLEQYSQAIPKTSDELEAFRQFVADKINGLAGVIIEPLIQMAAGMRFHSPESLRAIFEICQEQECLFIVDEIATGFGRTGSLFAFEQASIQPDLICLGKALSGGTLPLAATVARRSVYEAFHDDDFASALMHGPTFMGNPLACAAANASLDLFEKQPRLVQVEEISNQLNEQLGPLINIPTVKDVRVRGAVGVVQLDHVIDKSSISFFVDQGVWIRPLRDVIYLTPPFTISKTELNQLCHAIRQYVVR